MITRPQPQYFAIPHLFGHSYHADQYVTFSSCRLSLRPVTLPAVLLALASPDDALACRALHGVAWNVLECPLSVDKVTAFVKGFIASIVVAFGPFVCFSLVTGDMIKEFIVSVVRVVQPLRKIEDKCQPRLIFPRRAGSAVA